jgi:sporulation protein YqfC
LGIKRYGGLLRNQLTGVLELPKDVVYDLPKITMVGDVQLYIENHRGIIEYNPDSVRVSVSLGEIEINGKDLVIRVITRDEIHLDGTVRAVRCKR